MKPVPYWLCETWTARDPRIDRLASRLGISRNEARGVVMCLFSWAATYAPTGILSDYDPSEIAGALDLSNDPKQVLTALVGSGWIARVGRTRDRLVLVGADRAFGRVLIERVRAAKRSISDTSLRGVSAESPRTVRVDSADSTRIVRVDSAEKHVVNLDSDSESGSQEQNQDIYIESESRESDSKNHPESYRIRGTRGDEVRMGVVAFARAYRDETGTDYAISWGKDCRLVKDILNVCGDLKAVEAVFERFASLRRTDPWYRRLPFTLTAIRGMLNDLRSRGVVANRSANAERRLTSHRTFRAGDMTIVVRVYSAPPRLTVASVNGDGREREIDASTWTDEQWDKVLSSIDADEREDAISITRGMRIAAGVKKPTVTA